jgi:hypothetical protein
LWEVSHCEPTAAFPPFPPVHRAHLERVLWVACRQSSNEDDRLKRADSARTRVALGRTGVRAKPVIPLRARNGPHRPLLPFRIGPLKGRKAPRSGRRRRTRRARRRRQIAVQSRESFARPRAFGRSVADVAQYVNLEMPPARYPRSPVVRRDGRSRRSADARRASAVLRKEATNPDRLFAVGAPQVISVSCAALTAIQRFLADLIRREGRRNVNCSAPDWDTRQPERQGNSS